MGPMPPLSLLELKTWLSDVQLRYSLLSAVLMTTRKTQATRMVI